ncbi:MAG: flagellar export chaperone FliS [Myxococcota bacterium]
MHALAAYKSRRVETASPLQLLVMLNQEMLRRIELGAIQLEAANPVDASAHFHHAREILTELTAALDPVNGPTDLTARLGDLYRWSAAELVAAGREKDPGRARKVGDALMPVLEGWSDLLRRGV